MRTKLIGLVAALSLLCLPLAARAAAEQGSMNGMSNANSMNGMQA